MIAYEKAGPVAITASGKLHALVYMSHGPHLAQVAGTGFLGGVNNLYSIPGRRFIAALPCRRSNQSDEAYAISSDGSVGACLNGDDHVVEFSLRPFHVLWRSVSSISVSVTSHAMKVLNNGEVVTLMSDSRCGVPGHGYAPDRAYLIGTNGRTVRTLNCALFAVGTGTNIIESLYDGHHARFVDPRSGKWVLGTPEAVLKDGSVLYRDNPEPHSDLKALLRLFMGSWYRDKSLTLRVTGRRGYIVRDIAFANYTERNVVPMLLSNGLLERREGVEEAPTPR